MSEVMPNRTSSKLVRAKALMAFESFWIFLSRFSLPAELLLDTNNEIHHDLHFMYLNFTMKYLLHV